MANRFDELRQQAGQVRQIDLPRVLKHIGARPDTLDRAKWHTVGGVISVTGPRFYNWTQAAGGGGAIDLVMQVLQLDFVQAVSWLTGQFASPALPTSPKSTHRPRRPLVLPAKNDQGYRSLENYLTAVRGLPMTLIRMLIDSGKLYADHRLNAVFLLLGKGKTTVGAELRGTGIKPWHALAPGSRKDHGCFCIGQGCSRKIVLCESAIDAISCAALDLHCLAVSTAGAHPHPAWLPKLINKGYQIHCGYDADETGDQCAQQMISRYPSVIRLCPTCHDWNDQLKNSRWA